MLTPLRGMLGSDYTLSYTFNDGFSGFGAGIISATLPVGLLDFEGSKHNSGVLLKWKAEHEMNINYYEVQRSANGLDYETIGNIKSFGLTGNGNNYSMMDNSAGNVNYYRLKIIDNEGNFNFSKIVSVNLPGSSQKIYVLGNPFANTIRLRFASKPADKVNLRLLDIAGKLLIAKEFTNVSNTIEFNVLPGYLSKGVYVLEAIADGKRFTYKVVKD